MKPPKTDLQRVRAAYSQRALKNTCQRHERDFNMYGTRYRVDQDAPHDYFYFKDNGSDILAVAHLDTVVDHEDRRTYFADSAEGPVVFSGALDDRLGAYIITDMLPKLGVNVDVLLTVGEESASSTAALFEPPKDYGWMIEFDRGGTDVVMYQYEDATTRRLVKDCGAAVGFGSYSDISYLTHLGCKGFNWGVGYQDYHSTRGHAFLNDTWDMLTRFLTFHEANADAFLDHDGPAAKDEWYDSWSGDSHEWSSKQSLADMFSDPSPMDDIDDAEWEEYVEHKYRYKIASIHDENIPY